MAGQNDSQAPIIIKKIHKGDHGHHGGAWKVAYADFVTAMMAFFLLLWLLSSTSEEQKDGISNYFTPVAASLSGSGSDGMLMGRTMDVDGAQISSGPRITVPQSVDDEFFAPETQELEDELLDEVIEQRENEQFEKLRQEIEQAMNSDAELSQLIDNLKIDQTEEGLRIQILDQEEYAMFPTGSSAMYPETRQILALVAQVVDQVPNELSISGHTDSRPFSRADIKDNWDLSSERANATRRALMDAGMPSARIRRVVGRADRDHLFPDEPDSPKNRRISIILLREGKK